MRGSCVVRVFRWKRSIRLVLIGFRLQQKKGLLAGGGLGGRSLMDRMKQASLGGRMGLVCVCQHTGRSVRRKRKGVRIVSCVSFFVFLLQAPSHPPFSFFVFTLSVLLFLL